MTEQAKKIGFTCAYAPLPLIDAAGYVPYRILPMGEWADQAGQLLHDNLCPHVKRILDRAMADDLPELGAMVFVNSCDAMRRVSDAWHQVRPQDQIIRIDLPATTDEQAIAYLADEIARAWQMLAPDRDSDQALQDIKSGIERYNQVAQGISALRTEVSSGRFRMAAGEIQSVYNRASTQSFDATLDDLVELMGQASTAKPSAGDVPIFLFGNVLPDPEAFTLFEGCGAKIAGDDFCTGSRFFNPISINPGEELFYGLARNMLSRPPCARTFDPSNPLGLAEEMTARAKACGAKGVIAYTMKFCDPYLARLPVIRQRLKQAEFPFLFLEGDCTLRSIGQQRTRIEAFIEMLR